MFKLKWLNAVYWISQKHIIHNKSTQCAKITIYNYNVDQIVHFWLSKHLKILLVCGHIISCLILIILFQYTIRNNVNPLLFDLFMTGYKSRRMIQVNIFPRHALGVMPRVHGGNLLSQSKIMYTKGLYGQCLYFFSLSCLSGHYIHYTLQYNTTVTPVCDIISKS